MQDGLPHNYIFDMVQDREGFIWLATFGGLSRYDGHRFVNFTNDPNDERSLSDDGVRNLFVDSKGTLWVGTYSEGINKFIPSNNTFERYLAKEWIFSFGEDYQGNLWVGSKNGLIKVSKEGGIEERFIEKSMVDSIFEIDRELYFSARIEKDFMLYKIVNGKAVKVKNIIVTFFMPNRSEAGTYWLGTNRGLYLYRPENNSWTKFLHDKRLLEGIYYDDKTIWLVAINDGIIIFDAEKKVPVQNLRSDKGANKLSSDESYSIIKDGAGVIWVCGNEGLMKIKPSAFSNILFRSDKDGLPIAHARGIQEDKHGNIWAGTKALGLAKYNPVTKEVRYYPYPGLDYWTIFELKFDLQGNLWLGGSSNLFKFNVKDNTWQNYNHIYNQRLSVYSIVPLKSGKLLIGTNFEGIVLFDPVLGKKEKSFVHNPDDPNTLPINFVVDITPISEKLMAASTLEGLGVLNIETGEVDNSLYQLPKGLPRRRVENTIIDKQRTLWVNIGTMLSKISGIDAGQTLIKHYTKKDKIIVSDIQDVIEDQYGYIWMSTSNGLLRHNPKDDQFLLFNKNDGLVSEHFFSSSSLLSSDGLLYFSGPGGLVKFDPNDITLSQYKPPVKITGVSIDYKPITISQEINLTHEHRALAFEFVALDYSAAEKNQYAYKLAGFDKDWVYSGTRNEAVYTNLPAREYTFMVKGTNSDGVWSNQQAQIKLIVWPPWWFSRWAYIAYAIMLLLTVSLIVKVRTLQITRYATRLEKEVSERTGRIKELLDKKNELFAHVSHELRTPLTLILGPVSQLLERDLDRVSRQKVQMVKRNSQRLLKMVDQLLTLAKASTPGLVKRCPQDVNLVTSLIVASVKPLAAEKDIEIELNCLGGFHVKMMADSLETILLNLCVNAIKYTPSGGQVYVDIYGDNETVTLKVSDTGPGIPQGQQEKIFERFTRISKDGHGVGLGLALVKELVEAHEGRIHVESTVGAGATFILQLPALKGEKPSLRNEPYDLLSRSVVDNWYEFEPSVQMLDGQEQPARQQDVAQILIIDDEKDMCNYLASVLTEYECHIEHDGQQGIDYAKNHIPDLILSDIMMPEKDGFEVVQSLRDNINTSHIPIILLTAKGDKESRLKAYHGYVDDYITKPFDADELRIRIQASLAVRDLIKQRFNGRTMNDSQEGITALPDLHPKDKDFLNQFREMVAAHYQESAFNVKEMVALMNMSERPLQRKLKALLGLTPNNYLKVFRLEKAADYLKNHNLSIDEIIERIGMQSRSHFYAYFKAYFGVTPKEYKKGGRVSVK